MCLSTAYKNKVSDKNILMKNVMSVSSSDGKVTLVDLMERKKVIEGILKEANLMDNYILIESKDDE